MIAPNWYCPTTNRKQYWNSLPYDIKGYKPTLRSHIAQYWRILNSIQSGFIFIIMLTCTIIFGISDLDKVKYINKLEKDLMISNIKIETQGNNFKQAVKEIERLKSHMSAYDKKPKEDIVRYVLAHYKKTPESIINQIAETIMKKSAEHNLPWVTIVGLIEVESNFNPYLVSSKGARGLMQVMYTIWGKELNIKSKYALHDIEMGIDNGCKVLKHYLGRTNNNMTKALQLYFGGNDVSKRVRPTKRQKKYSNDVYAATGRFINFRTMPIEEEETIEEEEIIEEKKIDLRRAQKETGDYVEIQPIQSEVEHVIKLGDTLGKIAKWYTGSVDNWKSIVSINPDIVPERLFVGQKIKIPNELIKNRSPMPEDFE